jgi:hypothetical protein
MGIYDDHADLFYRYLEVCNKALQENKDRFPFKQILTNALHENAAKKIEVSIIDDRPGGAFVMDMAGEKISAKPHEDCADCQCDALWRVNKTYLQDVIAHPEVYIKNPAKIDWDWLFDGQSDPKTISQN